MALKKHTSIDEWQKHAKDAFGEDDVIGPTQIQGFQSFQYTRKSDGAVVAVWNGADNYGHVDVPEDDGSLDPHTNDLQPVPGAVVQPVVGRRPDGTVVDSNPTVDAPGIDAVRDTSVGAAPADVPVGEAPGAFAPTPPTQPGGHPFGDAPEVSETAPVTPGKSKAK